MYCFLETWEHTLKWLDKRKMGCMHRSICQRKQTLFGQPPSYFVYGDYILTMDSLISSTCDPENSWRAQAHPACLLCLHRAVEERSNKDAVAVLGRLHLHLTLSPTRKTSTSQNGVRCSRVLLKRQNSQNHP